eukprot:2713823-Prymnesium_polylepis.1
MHCLDQGSGSSSFTSLIHSSSFLRIRIGAARHPRGGCCPSRHCLRCARLRCAVSVAPRLHCAVSVAPPPPLPSPPSATPTDCKLCKGLHRRSHRGATPGVEPQVRAEGRIEVPVVCCAEAQGRCNENVSQLHVVMG